MLGGFMVGGAMEGGAIFFLREWRPRDGRSSGDLLSCLASPLLSRSRPAMPDRMDRGSPKSSSNSSAFMSILFAFLRRGALCGLWPSCALYGSWLPWRGARTAGLRAVWEWVRGTPSPRAVYARCPSFIPPHSIKPNHQPGGRGPRAAAGGARERSAGVSRRLRRRGEDCSEIPVFSSVLTPLALVLLQLVFGRHTS